MNIYYVLGGVFILLLLWALGSYLVVRSVEQPSYKVIEKRDGYEIRQYEPYIIAETEVSGTYGQATSSGFSIIADYIFGNNTSQSKISMTAPVVESSSEKIAMTTPVINTLLDEKTRVVSFILPSEYTLETLLKPNNDRVTLREIPALKIAAHRFTWYANAERVENKKTLLKNALQRDGITIKGDTQVAQYNPPLSMPLILRNEILIPIDYITQ